MKGASEERMVFEGEEIPGPVYDQAQGRISALASRSRIFDGAVWNWLLERTQLSPLPAHRAISPGLGPLANNETLVRALRPLDRIPEAMRFSPPRTLSAVLAEELGSVVQSLSELERLAMDIVLRRALNPMEALATWPAEVLFSQTEISDILECRRDLTAREATGASYEFAEVSEYAGYICVIAKFTRLCNLRCAYCHDWRSGPGQTMPFQVLTRLFGSLLGSRHRIIEVVWHGGEPTLLGRRAILRILALQRAFVQPGQVVRNRLQTNGTTIDEAWCEFFGHYGFRLGVSLDATPELHNVSRLDARGRGSYERALRGLQLLRTKGLLDHVYVVITRAVVERGPEAIVEALRAANVTNVGMLAVAPGGNLTGSDVHLDRQSYVDFLLGVHRYRNAHPRPWLAVRELDAALKAVRGEHPGHCELAGKCIGTFYSVETNGDISHCDRFVGDEDYVLGNVCRDSFDALQTAPSTLRLIRHNERSLNVLAAECPYFQYCRGWCPHERYLDVKNGREEGTECCGLGRLFSSLTAEASVSRSQLT